MCKGLTTFIAVVVVLLNRAALAFDSGNTVGFSRIELRPGVNQFQTYMQEICGGSLKIRSFLDFATEGDRVIYDENGEMRVAVARREGGELHWFDLERNEKLDDARLPCDSNGSKLIYKSESSKVREVSLAGQSASFHDPKRVLFDPPPPKVVKIALPFKKRPTGRFCMIVRKDENMTERLDVRLSDKDTIVYADTGKEVKCQEKDIIGFEEFILSSNPLADKQVNMPKEDVALIEKKWETTVWLRQKAVEVVSLLKGEEVTWSALRTSAILFAITSILGSIIAFLFNLFLRKLWAAIVFFFRVFVWEKCHLYAFWLTSWRFVRRFRKTQYDKAE